MRKIPFSLATIICYNILDATLDAIICYNILDATSDAIPWLSKLLRMLLKKYAADTNNFCHKLPLKH